MAEAAGQENDVREREDADRFRSVAQLDMLHNLAARLNSLSDVQEIGNAITGELHTIIDYHSCRVYVLQDDGVTLLPVAFRGRFFEEYERETVEQLRTRVGEGITGWVAEHRESLLTPDATQVQFSVTIPGTQEDLIESMLAVPMVAGNDLIGVIVLSMLGYGKFDGDDQRVLEVLASHAAVAFENAKLFQAEREAAQTSAALLRLCQVLTSIHSSETILQEAIETVPSMIGCAAIIAYLRDEETGSFRPTRHLSVGPPIVREGKRFADVPHEVAATFLLSVTEPFVLSRELVAQVPEEYRIVEPTRGVLVAPFRWEPDGFGAFVLIATDVESSFSERDLRLARGVADITSLALGNARRFSELERFHELVEGLDAVFWEADPVGLQLSFLGGRAGDVFGADGEAWVAQGRGWGEHVLTADRDDALAACRQAVSAGEDLSLEYRVRTPAGRTAWVRDLVHVVRDAQGRTARLRGLMFDVTERKRAEQALRRSERKYSEAFKREREAAGRLRALDDMKNTFLEAVSHDLRTPLTSILGSALTLEQAERELPPEDVADLVHRIAANARKLERLLSDLLDLDRLQRGIITPQRRPTDLESLVRRAVEESRPLGDREVGADVRPGLVVSVDAAKVERILENLLSNAIRHTPPDARIWVRAEGHDGGALLAVEDEGPGVPREMWEAVFEPFRQVPGSQSGHSPGVGVGLSLVRRFAELHGGRAWVQDRAGGGASFRVFLPAR